MKKFLYLAIFAFAALDLASCQKLNISGNKAVPPVVSQIACQTDAKICSDGSSVGRIPPSCEFEPCPSPNADQARTVTVKGKIDCLPHKNQTGPQTDECAIGLRTADNKYYGLQNLDQKFVLEPHDKTVTITGKLKQDSKSNYAIVGVITVESVKE